MKIESIRKGKKNTYQITFEQDKNIILYDDLVVKYSLLPKKEITKQELIKIKKEQTELEVYYKAIQYITIKMRTKKELMNYLKKSQYDIELINHAIKKIEEEGHLNEEKYIDAFLSDSFRFQNDGPIKLKQKLRKEELDERKIEDGLEEISKEQWMEKLKKLMQKKANAKHSDSLFKWQQKCLIYFINLGYQKEWIEEIIPMILWQNDNAIIKNECAKLYRKWGRKYSGSALDLQVKKKLYEKGFLKEEIEEVIQEQKNGLKGNEE